MSGPTLEPFAARLRWRFPAALTVADWTSLLCDYLQALAGECVAEGPCVIGHIKAIALFPEGGYLRGSAVSAGVPADVEAGGSLPEDCAELTFTLNLLAYGLPLDVAQRLSEQVAGRVASLRQGQAELQPLSAEPHDHHGHT